jgi:LuxR family maltose regulon positive regulatory protein
MNNVEKKKPGDGFIMVRPRVEALLSKALEKPVTLIHAGAGCGKSRAVHSYLMNIKAHVVWFQLSEADNSPSVFWENVCNTVAQSEMNAALVLRAIGFPGSGERFKMGYEQLEGVVRTDLRYVFVFDDIHLINDPEVMSFLFALVGGPLPGVNQVYISREETISSYDVGTTDEDFALIDEQDLLFTKEEVAEYLSMLEIDPRPAIVDDIYSASEGLAHLINLTGKVIRKQPESIGRIGDVIRRNIARIIDDSFFSESTDGMKKFFVRLSLLNHLSHSLVHSLPDGEEHTSNAMRLTTMIRNDFYMNAYHLHHIFVDFLREKEDLLTEEEKAETYRIAAKWCSENDYGLEAMSYYEKVGDYSSIALIGRTMMFDVNFHTGGYLIDMLERAPTRAFDDILYLRVLYTKMLLAVGRLDDAVKRLEAFISEMESWERERAENTILAWLYCNLGYAKIVKARDTGVYDFAVFFEKAAGCIKKAEIEKANRRINATVLPYACVVGNGRKGDPERFIKELSKAIPFAVQTLGGCMYGHDDLTRSEVAYYRGDMAACERYAIQSCMKARDAGQSYIEGRAIFMLLRMNLARGRFEKIVEVLAQYEELMNRVNYYLEHIQQDIVFSWYYASIGETENVAQWIKGDFTSVESDAYITGLEDMTKQKYYIMEKKYHVLLAFLDRRPTSHGVRKFLFGRIGMIVGETVSLYRLKDKKGAIASLRKAYELASPNSIDMPFIEMGNHMRSLTGAALREKDCGIPRAWLEQIRRKSATYAKRVAHVKSRYRQETGKDGDIQLTLKEKEVLQDMSQGLSRTEIAEYRGISVNTVKAMLQIIYEKLGADNSMDALRISISKGLI